MKWWKQFLITILLCLIIPNISWAATQPILRVGILDNQRQVTISAQQDFVMKVPQENRSYRFPKGKELVFSWQQGKALLNNKPLRGDNIIIAVKNKQPVLVNNRPYRGALNLLVNKQGITVVNRLGIEEYLYGVVPEEMPYAWPKEALKAQAVAARTFALNYKNTHGSGNKPYDLCSSTRCQVYKGIAGEKPGIKEVVDSTKGMVITYNREPIAAVFHAASGGSTISSAEGWGSAVAYLQGVMDSKEKSPYQNWTKEYTPGEFQAILRKQLPKIQRIKKVDMSNYPQNKILAKEKYIIIHDTTGATYKLSGTDFRNLFKLDSSNFRIETVMAATKVQPKVAPVATKQMDIKPTAVATVKKAKKIKGNIYNRQLPAKTEVQVTTQSQGVKSNTGSSLKPETGVKESKEIVKFKIVGSGLGHRIGMSQWGAKAEAEAGKDYQGILNHYYTGITLQQLY